MSPERSLSPAEENERLRQQVAELEETLHAIRTGQVDALVHGNDIYTLESSETASNRFRGQVLEQISDVVIAVDNDYRITYLNEAAEIQYGRRSADVLGMRLRELYEYTWVNEGDEEASQRALREQGEWRGENIHTKRNGEKIHVGSSVKVLADADGKAIGYLAVMRDITDQVGARKALEDSALHKDHFLATLAHELRNPLSPLMNGLQLLDGHEADQELIVSTRVMMQRQLDHLVRLVDDLMDMSRISRGKLELRKEPLDLAEVVATAVEASKPVIDHSAHDLRIDIEKGRFPMKGDATRLAQVIANLLNNAAKYTPTGGRIELSLWREDDHALLTVKDNGIGIRPEAIDRIFDMFTQVDGSLLGAGGLGIGLNIAQRLTAMHGGTLTARSEGEGRGSEFLVRLPLHRHAGARGANGRPEIKDAAAAAPARRILVVDDNTDGAMTLVLILRKLGHEVEVAFDGAQALSVGATFLPDLVIMDLGMPIMDGYEACRRMRTDPWGQRARIIAVSGWGQEQDRARSQKAGFDEHLIKPIERHTLQRMLQMPTQRDAASAVHERR